MEALQREYDGIVVGGGHNGLVSAAYLARAGLKTLVLEARPVTGGAAVTEKPWGPEFKMTALSYVMSLMPPTVIRDLKLEEFGYRVLPMGPWYVPSLDGRSLHMTGEHRHDHEQLAAFSKKDADAMSRYEEWLGGIGKMLAPLLLRTPPALGSHAVGDLLDQLKLAWSMRGLNARSVADATKLFTMSIADLLDEWFESDIVKGSMSINGVIGTWAGPMEPGTAYVMMHHTIGDIGDGKMGSWGYPVGGMGAVADAIRRSAEHFGATVVTGARVERILTRGGRATGVALEDGREFLAPTVVSATHPQITFLNQLEPRELPEDFVADIRRWRSRSGTVKVNVALSGLPRFTANPDLTAQELSGPIDLAESLEYVEDAFIDARSGRPAARPFADSVIPSTVDDTLCPPGTHVMSMFTQWVPHTWADEPHTEELEAYADRVIDLYDQLAPGFKGQVIHRQVIGPHQMQEEYGLVGGNIFHGELSPEQLFHMRPAPGYADFTTPVKGLYQCSSATHGGGGVTGIAGYLATRRILKDRRTPGRRK
ncbi:NAD(P)/FAD-dependent oxidoreductase [Streptomyces sp. NPDC051940]|uniref:phytoene desaturase family protein n=1 Tax=Streptomyces sp. NPDC051940 TaxID=3155675 RepID=UPI0034172FE6